MVHIGYFIDDICLPPADLTGELRLSGNQTVTEYEMSGKPYSQKSGLKNQLLPIFRHCTEELSPILRLRRIRLHVIVTSFKRQNDVASSNAMNDVIFQ